MTDDRALDEYKIVCEFMRSYAQVRFYPMIVFVGTIGAIITSLTSPNVRSLPGFPLLLKVGALAFSLTFLVLNFRATTHSRRLRDRANVLAQQLGFPPFRVTPLWSPLTATGARLWFHLVVTAAWALLLAFPLA